MKSRKSNKIGKNFQPGVINSALKSKRISGIIDKILFILDSYLFCRNVGNPDTTYSFLDSYMILTLFGIMDKTYWSYSIWIPIYFVEMFW